MESSTNISKNSIDWETLRRLRARFLDGKPGEDYWRSPRELESYDATFAERIGWKWDAVIAELKQRGWAPPGNTVFDWGCGTGVAGRRVLSAWPDQLDSLLVWDRSAKAIDFATRRARASFPRVRVAAGRSDSSADLLLVSHVINELPPDALERLLKTALSCKAVIWVEPGTAADSRALIAVRERLLGEFNVVAPCTHALACPLLQSEHAAHWCHHFARPPQEVFTDGDWARFAKIMEIDLGTVPFSFLVLDRRPVAAGTASRVIGVPRHYKGFDKVLSCQAEGLKDLVLQKRDAPELHKEMKKNPGSLYEWERDGDKIRGANRIF
jgi:ribosomal protein RSM22 (predicted rRNA methylase)